MEEIFAYCCNYFEYTRAFKTFKIENGSIDFDIPTGTYYRIVGSLYNDGVYVRGQEQLTDEEFYGGVWLMAVPNDFINLMSDIAAWKTANDGKPAYNSESFEGYSYSIDASKSTWQGYFKDRLARWKKICLC